MTQASENLDRNSPACIPSSTYRLQFTPALRFHDAIELVDYLDALGIGAIYSSPLFRARPGSSHGYDVVDPNNIHPGFGSEAEFQQLAEGLQQHGLGLVMDIVPNHMAIDDNNNVWWQDVLENGRGSPYAGFFDIDWNPPQEELRDKILVPVLGDQYGKILENGELRLVYDAHRFFIHYHDRRFPVAPRTWPSILRAVLEEHPATSDSQDPARMELESIIMALERLPPCTEQDAEKNRERQRETEVTKRRLAALVDESAAIRTTLDAAIRSFNGQHGDPRSFDRIDALLAEQTYRLSYWRVAVDEINYRRFFDINELAAVHVEDPQVFEAVHAMTFRFLERGWVTGLRVDHIDGLLDPEQYVASLQESYRRIRETAGDAPTGAKPLYIVVEKILGVDERLRASWPVYGTTGYDFLNLLNGVFAERRSARRLREIYMAFTELPARFADVYYDGKKTVVTSGMPSEVYMLSRRLSRIAQQHRWSRDFTQTSLHRLLEEVIACFPVYRTYVRPEAARVDDEDRQRIHTALRIARRRNPSLSRSLFDFLGSILLMEDPDGLTEAQRQQRHEFALRFQQLTGPVTAKGFEDTALYRLYPLASLNDVGSEPSRFGTSVDEFHRRQAEQSAAWPATMLATATHDTKRGEDVRARINVLSEVPDAWQEALTRWHAMNRRLKSPIDGSEAPDPNEEYLFYQTLIGTWPMDTANLDEHESYVARIGAYMLKAAKEAKLHTSWVNTDEEFEGSLDRFIRAALSREENAEFLTDFSRFQASLAAAGMHNGLAQALLKICSPGVPDFYQGTELWDLHLVDPDNRRPVDFELRRKLLADLQSAATLDPRGLVRDLVEHWPDGRIKLYLTWRALQLRRQNPRLFLEGEYIPLTVTGRAEEHVIAFARRLDTRWAVAIVPRCMAGFLKTGQAMPDADVWRETYVQLPSDAPQTWRDEISLAESPIMAAGTKLDVQQLFERFPVALLSASSS